MATPLEQLTAAVTSLATGTLSQAATATALELLDSFVRAPVGTTLPLLSTILEHPDAPECLRAFGLTSLGDVIERQWDAIAPAAHTQIRGLCLHVLSRCSPSSPRYQTEKAAALVAEVAERTYPQLWPDFFTQVQSMSTLGDPQTEGLMLVLKQLAEDCSDSDFNAKLTAARRADVLRGLHAEVPPMLPQIYQYMQTKFGLLEQPPGPGRAAAAASLCAALGMLRGFVPWMRAADLFSPRHDFSAVFAALLRPAGLPQLRAAALACLRELSAVGGRLEAGMFLGLIETLPGIAGETLAPSAAGRDEPDGWDWSLLQGMAELMEEGLNKIVVADANYGLDGAREAAALCTYLATMASAVSELRTFRAAAAMLPMWYAACKSSGASRKAVAPLVAGLLDAYLCRTARRDFAAVENGTPRTAWGPSPQGPEFDAELDEALLEEFTEEEEYKSFWAVLRAQTNQQLVASLVNAAPFAVLDWLGAALPREIAAASAVGDGTSAPAPRLEALSSMAEAVLVSRDSTTNLFSRYAPRDSAAENDPARAAGFARVCAGVEGMLGALLRWDPEGRRRVHGLVLNKLVLVEACRSTVSHNPAALQPILQLAFSLVEYTGPEGPPEEGTVVDSQRLDPPVAAVRRRAAAGLIRLAGAAPRALLPHLDALCTATANATCRMAHTDTARLHLFEAVALVAKASPDLARGEQCLDALLRNPLQDFLAPQTVAAFASPQALLGLLGCTSTPPPAATADPAAADALTAEYARVHTALNTVFSIGRRLTRGDADDASYAYPTARGSLRDLAAATGNPFALVWAHIGGPLANLAASLHALRAEPMRTALRQGGDAALLLSPAAEEVRAKTTVGRVETTGIKRRQLPLRSRWPGMMNELRSLVYQSARLSIEQGVPFVADAERGPSALAAAVFSSLDAMEHRHLASLITHVAGAAVLCCPPPLLDTHVLPWFGPLAGHILAALDAAWRGAGFGLSAAMPPAVAAEHARCGLTLPADMDAATQEALLSKTRRELTHSYVDLWSEALAIKGRLLVIEEKPRKKKAKADKATVAAAAAAALPPPPGSPAALRLELDEAKRRHAGELSNFFLQRHPLLTEHALRLCERSFEWRDAFACRRAIPIATVAVDRAPPCLSTIVAASSLFVACVGALVTAPKWVAQMEYDILALARDIYMRLVTRRGVPGEAVLGLAGANQQWSAELAAPRATLAGFPGISEADLARMDKAFARAGHNKEHKEALREIVRQTREAIARSAQASAATLLGGGKSELDEAPQRYADVKAALPARLRSKGKGAGPGKAGLEEIGSLFEL